MEALASLVPADLMTSANEDELHGQPIDASLKPRAFANREQKSISDIITFTAVFVPLFVIVAYVLGCLLESLRLKSDNHNVNKLTWITKSEGNGNKDKCNIPSSFFVINAAGSGSKGLDTTFNFFSMFAILTYANTNLYFALRSPAGLTKLRRKLWNQIMLLMCLGAYIQVSINNTARRDIRIVAISNILGANPKHRHIGNL
ncbi:hypothetical protein LZ30DRAFT_693302 [Colletotrichum cereale]|nr:hypothetical protein LZ30DRAFT_693302 [Colletotrichum cereale]